MVIMSKKQNSSQKDASKAFAKQCIEYVYNEIKCEYSYNLADSPKEWRSILPYTKTIEDYVIQKAQYAMAILDAETVHYHNVVFWHKVAAHLSKYLVGYTIKNPIYKIENENALSEQELKAAKHNNFKAAEGVIKDKLTIRNPFYQRLAENIARFKTKNNKDKRK